jgi:hypothetical protein
MKHKKISIFIILFLVAASFANGEEFHDFDKDSQLEDLSPPVRCFFEAAAQNDSKALVTCFSGEVSVNIAGMQFNGREEVAAFGLRAGHHLSHQLNINFKPKRKKSSAGMANTGKIKNFYTIQTLVSFIEDRKKLVEYGA